MFKWIDSYSVGVPLFDKQHQVLFDLANQLFHQLQMPSDDQSKKIADLVYELVRYTQYHFSQEEKMMKLYHFPDYQNHLEEHHQFVDYLIDIEQTALDENPVTVGKDLLMYLIQWITHHIQTTDQKYHQYLSGKF